MQGNIPWSSRGVNCVHQYSEGGSGYACIMLPQGRGFFSLLKQTSHALCLIPLQGLTGPGQGFCSHPSLVAWPSQTVMSESPATPLEFLPQSDKQPLPHERARASLSSISTFAARQIALDPWKADRGKQNERVFRLKPGPFCSKTLQLLLRGRSWLLCLHLWTHMCWCKTVCFFKEHNLTTSATGASGTLALKFARSRPKSSQFRCWVWSSVLWPRQSEAVWGKWRKAVEH